MKGIIDRFEEGYAVIEVDGKTIDVSRNELSKGVKEGDSVILVDGLWKTDKNETKRRKQQIQKLMDQVWED